MKKLEILLPGGLKAMLPENKRKPSTIPKEHSGNVYYGSSASDIVENDLFRNTNSATNSGQILANSQPKKQDYNILSIPIYYDGTYLGDISLNLDLPDFSLTVPPCMIHINFYIMRYFKIHETLNRYKLLKKRNVVSERQSTYILSLDFPESLYEEISVITNKKSKSTYFRELEENSADIKRTPSHVNDKTRSEKATSYPTGKVSKNPYNLEIVWLKHCIETYLPNMQKLFDHYSALTVDKHDQHSYGRQTPQEAGMNRLGFWQLLREYGLHKLFDSVFAIEELLSLNPFVGNDMHHMNADILRDKVRVPVVDHKKAEVSLKVKNIYDPFQRLRFHQFVHCLLELSWIIFGGKSATYETSWPTHMSSCLHRLMGETLKRQTHEGQMLRSKKYRRMIPVMYKQFTKLGNPLPFHQIFSILLENNFPSCEHSFTASEYWQLIGAPDECRKDHFCKSHEMSHAFDVDMGDVPEIERFADAYGNRLHCGSDSSIDTCGSNLTCNLNAKLNSLLFNKYNKKVEQEMESQEESTVENNEDSYHGNFELSEIINTGCELDVSKRLLPTNLSNSFFKLEAHEIFSAAGQICPRIIGQDGAILNFSIYFSFLEYCELLIFLCAHNAERTRNMIKSTAIEAFYRDVIVVARAKARSKWPSGGKKSPPAGTAAGKGTNKDKKKLK